MTSTPQSTVARVLTLAAVIVTSSGCAMKGDIRLIQEEIRAIAARQDSLMAELRVEAQLTQDTLQIQGDQIFDFRGDINRQLQQINQSLVRLEAIAGENQRGMTSIRDQLANMRTTPTSLRPTTVAPDSMESGGSESVIGGRAGTADGLWNAAWEQLRRGSLTSASRAFQEFIEYHGTDDRVPDAHFYLADILWQQERPEDALEAFQEIQQLFPTAATVPQALFRIAVVQEHLGDVDAARATLERIMNTYPDAIISMLARDMLSKIG